MSSPSVTGGTTNIQLQTSLAAGDEVELEVDGADGSQLTTLTGMAAADGSVGFMGVSVPAPGVTLHATGHGLCGIGRASIAVSATGSIVGSACTLALSPAPEANAYYAATGIAGVLSSLSDPDPETPGYQTTVQVTTLPGWTAELFETAQATTAVDGTASGLPDDVSLGMVTAAADGIAAKPVSVADGQIGFYAICHGPSGNDLASAPTMVLADTTPPGCALTAPPPGATLTPGFDTDGVPKNATWLLDVTGHAGDDDVAGEPVTLMTGVPGGPLTAVPVADADANGTTTTMVTLIPGSAPSMYEIDLQMRDHAGNTCAIMQPYDVEPKGCDIQVVSPTTTVTQDADPIQDGVQVDIELKVSKACVSRMVSATCDHGSPSSFPDSTGIVHLTETVCQTEPCHAQDACTFHVTRANGVTSQVPATIVFSDVE
ncbi:MAG TPA: hypothetical protein VH165_27960 [Kofleriaceae bacterium]|nr:hypothetical protein [Kofleriaceae bacterium]